MKSLRYLDDIMRKYQIKNDAELARHMKWPTSKISQYRTGKRVMDDEACLAVALALAIHPMEIVGAACIDRAEKTGQKSLWEVFMSRTAATAATLALATSAVTLFLTPKEAEARTYGPTSTESTDSLYIMSNTLLSQGALYSRLTSLPHNGPRTGITG